MAQTLWIAVKGDTKDLVTSLKNAENVTVKSGKKMADSVGTVDKAYGMLKNAVVAYLGVQTVKSIVQIADSYSLLESRLKLVTATSEELKEVQATLLTISNDSRVSYEATANLYARLGRSTENLGTSTEDLLKVTEAISKALIVSGATATEAENALIQLSQGLASGTLRGDELRSVLEQVPRVAKAIADGMGITVGQLREFGKAGKLTAEAVIPALISQLGKISDEFGNIDVTVSQAWTVFTNAYKDILRDTDKASTSTKDLSGAIMDMAKVITDNKEPIVAVFTGIATVISAVVKEFATLSDKIEGVIALGFGEISIFELMTSDAEELKVILDEIGDSGSVRNMLKELGDEQASLTAQLQKDRHEQTKWFGERELLSDAAKQRIVERISAIKDEIKVIKTGTTEIKDEYKDRWTYHTEISDNIISNNEDVYESALQQARQATKVKKDNWQIQLKDQEKILTRVEKADKESYKKREKAAEKALEEIKKEEEERADYHLKLSIAIAKQDKDMWLARDMEAKDALDRVVQYEKQAAADAKQASADLAKQVREDLKTIEDESLSVWEVMGDGFSDMTLDMGDDMSDFTDDLIDNHYDDLSDAWDDLWKSLIKTMADALIAMAATWAASKISTAFAGWVLHDGMWDFKDDESLALLQEGEMVLPTSYADQVRRNLDGYGGDFQSLVDATDSTASPDGWETASDLGSALSDNFGDAFGQALGGIVSGLMTGTLDPTSVIGPAIEGLSLGSIDDVVSDTVSSFSPSHFAGAPSSYSQLGGVVGLASHYGAFGTSPVTGVLSSISEVLGQWAGELIGDMLDDREFESLRDAVEDGTLGGIEAHTFAMESMRVGAEDTTGSSTLGGWAAAAKDAWDSVKSVFGFDKIEFDISDVSDPTKGLGQEGSKDAGHDVGGSGGDRESSPGGAGGVHGGMDYIPKETTYLLDEGERVLSPRQNRDLTSYLSEARGKGEGSVSVTIMLNGRALNSIIEDVVVERQNSEISPNERIYTNGR